MNEKEYTEREKFEVKKKVIKTFPITDETSLSNYLNELNRLISNPYRYDDEQKKKIYTSQKVLKREFLFDITKISDANLYKRAINCYKNLCELLNEKEQNPLETTETTVPLETTETTVMIKQGDGVPKFMKIGGSKEKKDGEKEEQGGKREDKNPF